ncbi:hypothetical protein SAMN04489751_1532 [Brevibacterium sandarakinum]|uniref:Uncharacterized protein n=2 Tax=Brevibacterium sandarakinum TaxID=629680 RepID=A0A1H1QHT2_BRESA|nr:hypothetical protein SAMN04489751_1532 [Brevibacterium sandarakinum]
MTGKPHRPALVGVDSVEDMTSPDFMYPQPTDDELAAQQPYTTTLGSHAHVVDHTPASSGTETDHDGTPPAGANRPRLGKVAMVVAIIAAGLSLIASFVLGLTLGPMEIEYGYYFTDTPSWYRNLAIALFGLQALCTAIGITGLIMGIVSAATGRGRTQGIIAVAITVLAPFVSFAIFMILGFAFA